MARQRSASLTVFRETRQTLGDKTKRNPAFKVTGFGKSRKKAELNARRALKRLGVMGEYVKGVFKRKGKKKK